MWIIYVTAALYLIDYASTTSSGGMDLQSAYDACPIGNLFDSEIGSCKVCTEVIQGPGDPSDRTSPYSLVQPNDDSCYSETSCLEEPTSRDQLCACEFPLTLLGNNDSECGHCRESTDCWPNEQCLRLENHGNICALPCERDADCQLNYGFYPGMICKEPYYLQSSRNDVGKICACSAPYDLIRGFGCVDKQNLTVAPIDCYECEGAEDCAVAPFERGVRCGSNQGCFTKAVIRNWAPRSYNEYDHVFFDVDRNIEVSRGCLDVNASTERTRTSFLNGNKTLWQNCEVVSKPNGDEIECFSTCISRYCNWESVDPIVRVYKADDNRILFLILFGVLFSFAILIILLWSIYQHEKAVREQKEDDKGKLLDSAADYGATSESTTTPEPEAKLQPEPEVSKKKSNVVVEKEDITLKASSRINTGIKKKPPTEIKMGTKVTTKVVDEDE